MNDFFKSKRKIGLIIGAIFLALTLAMGTVAWVLIEEGFFALTSPAQAELSLGDFDYRLESELEEGRYGSGGEPEVFAAAPAAPVHNFPAEMRGVYLVPGKDFLTDVNASAAAIKAEVDAALSNARNLTMNTVVIDTVYDGRVIFDTIGAPQIPVGFDLMEYIVARAKEEGLFVYAIFDASLFSDNISPNTLLAVNSGTISRLASNLREFAVKYAPDGILIYGYTWPVTEKDIAFNTYLMTGGAIGFQNYLRQSPASVVKTASRTIRAYAPNVKVGLLVDAVWENSSVNPNGSDTSAAFTALSTGNADTKSFVEQGVVDFVAVQAFTSLTDPNAPFDKVVDWWADVARRQGIPMYVVHASSNMHTQNPGWQSPDQLTQQVIRASSIEGWSGGIFNSLHRLAENPQGATTALVRFYQGQVRTEHILTELQIVTPSQTTFATHEPFVTFTGASDPNFPVTVNGAEITTTDVNGYFTVSMQLNAGLNTFTFEHKARTITYNITRNVEILREVSPTGNIATDGNMTLTISAIAYENATVSALVNGVVVPMQIDESIQDEAARVSHFRRFVGQFTTPAGTAGDQNLGAIVVTADWNGHREILTGATVRVNRRVPVSDGVPVVVIADQARTYPPNTLNNISNPNFFPLPRGAMDYAVGNEITYTSRTGETYRYRVLASGVRVASADIQGSTDFVANNAISGLNVSTQGRFTYVTINTAQRVTYGIRYTGSEFIITFHHTTSTPGGSMALTDNPLFTNASWNENVLTLTLARNGGFLGYRAYYDANGNLAFRFNTPPASMSGARIAIDIGHGGNDPGALGFLAALPEAVINRLIAQMLADELQNRGAAVLLIDNSRNPSLRNRVAQAEAFNADIFVSIHNNASTRSSAVGTETFFFYSYGRSTATAIARHVSAALGTTNRGARQSYYHITLSAQFPSILVECGFMTNPQEYEKLIQERFQRAIAIGIADGIAEGLAAARTGITAAGSQSMGNAAGPVTGADDNNNNNEADDDRDNGRQPLEDLYFYDDYVFVYEGETIDLEFYTYPHNADVSGITFRSSDTAVATVSQNGRVTGVREGLATITISNANGRITETITVEVFPSW